jgi:hypothetical protein
MTAEEIAKQGLLKVIATLGGAIAVGMPTRELFQLLDDELKPLQLRRQAFERQLAEQWLEEQARTLRPRLPRGTVQRADRGDPVALALIAKRQARWVAEGRDAAGRKRRRHERETA